MANRDFGSRRTVRYREAFDGNIAGIAERIQNPEYLAEVYMARPGSAAIRIRYLNPGNPALRHDHRCKHRRLLHPCVVNVEQDLDILGFERADKLDGFGDRIQPIHDEAALRLETD